MRPTLAWLAVALVAADVAVTAARERRSPAKSDL
jgi:hypothetical protein